MNEYRKGCGKYKPSLLTSCAVISLLISFSEFTLAVYEYLLARDGSLVPAICTGVFLFLGCITLLYFIGVLKGKECLILPLITSQLIIVAVLGLLVIIWWICTLLSVFDLVHYKSPLESLSTKEFFIATGILLTAFFCIAFKISTVLYKGYKRVEKDNFYKRRIGNGVLKSMSRSNTFPPTYV